MKIALISYEFPPDTGFGGIGTYTFQMAKVLADRGHYVEVFSCSHTAEKLNQLINEAIILHRVKAPNRAVFSEAIVELFRERNSIIGFDIIESPEYCAEGLALRNEFPFIPMVVKLHTPLFLIKRMNSHFDRLPLKKKVKKLLGRKMYDKNFDKDYQLVSSADAVCSPSFSLAKILEEEWELKDIEIIPNVFVPDPAFMQLTISEEDCNVISYIGRLDIRKGILAIIDAIPFILKKHPHLKFRFIGGDGEAPNKQGSMKEYMLQKLHMYIANLDFTGYKKHEFIVNEIRDSGIIIMPSIWENYPYTCLEAMSAGKAVVASKNGGMKEMLEDVSGGLLIDPLKPKEIAKAILFLVKNPAVRVQMGENNREKMKAFGNGVALQAEAYYTSVIEQHSVKEKSFG